MTLDIFRAIYYEYSVPLREGKPLFLRRQAPNEQDLLATETWLIDLTW
jgi:hypothetical protein